MLYNPNKRRRSIRLKGYDYSKAGLYFITICVNRRGNPFLLPFGNIEKGEMILNDAGKMVKREWLKLQERYPNIELHEFVVMPNHFHAIIEIAGATLVVAPDVVAPDVVAPDVVAPDVVAPDVVSQKHDAWQSEEGQPQGIAPTVKPKTIGEMVGAFQSIVTVEYIRGVKQLGWESFNGKLWQRNYWEHIIRSERSFYRISEYINNNPKNWDSDKLNYR